MNSKNLIIILVTIGVSIVLVALGLFFLAKTNNLNSTNIVNSPVPQPSVQNLPSTQVAYPTSVGADWETYSNTKFAYSIKYPAGWATIINTSPGSNQETLANATSLDIFDSAAQKSYPEGVMTIQYLSAQPAPPTTWNKTEVTLAGKTVQKFEGDDNDLHIETYFIPVTSGIIEIDARYLPGESIKQTFDAMLSTLQL